MPLSGEQIQMLKDPETMIAFQQENPKQPGTKSHERYSVYMCATSIQDANEMGAKWADLSSDFEKGFLVFQNGGEMIAVPGKRAAPTGSPERMGRERARGPVRFEQEAALRVGMANGSGDMETVTERVEMSPATIALLRSMMKEEIKNGVEETERVVAKKVDGAMAEVREELATEKASRQSLEQRVLILEEQLKKQVPKARVQNEDDMDKSVVVVGGFGEVEAEEAENFVKETMSDVSGFEEVWALNPNPKIVFGRFATAQDAKKFLRTQKRQRNFEEKGLWASENRSLEERRRAQTLSKIKKFLIELGNYEAKDVVINYNTFRAHVRVAKKLRHVANVSEEAVPEWIDGDIDVEDEVKEAGQQFLDDLQQ